jgi:hypothetical protein
MRLQSRQRLKRGLVDESESDNAAVRANVAGSIAARSLRSRLNCAMNTEFSSLKTTALAEATPSTFNLAAALVG